MGQLATRAEDGKEIEAFSMSDVEWELAKSQPMGAYLMRGACWPAILKTSIRGLRYFAHAPGFPGVNPQPESYAHARLKIGFVQAARSLGLEAGVEVRGQTPNGEEWIADALVTDANGARYAIEVQLAPQTLDEFFARTERYRQSDVSVAWVLSGARQGTLSKAIHHRIGLIKNEEVGFVSDMEELLCAIVALSSEESYPETEPPLIFGRTTNLSRLSFKEFVEGLVSGRAVWDEFRWKWEASAR